ncbi:alkaline phosphatase family protein [Jatrophihabitans telluris]|uniref:Alkaline phosphatase family protein n=1 Tax=Jatrophihabitans telluris TaxID=2038343 RepID=A0ABY4QUA6_9ACTN|nr:alkaline phosphatase family protein [Jatrophihabitans telluris]UQX87008.1 alkaline phosphatase family protein [Jatrophihabitans telluris]
MRRHAMTGRRGIAAVSAVTLLASTAVAVGFTPAAAASNPASHSGPTLSHTHASSCQLGNGVKHVISIVFDNVHFSRDNPNVPSDLEQMPTLLKFLTSNGTVLSNTHTPLIAHTADDSLTIYTGLYGDRHGQPLTNSYKTYNPDGSTDPAGSFAYWTDPVYDTAKTPTAGHDTAPTMAYSASVPARSTNTGQQTPAPWVPFTRAGCSVGDFSTANMVLENTALDLPTVFGAGSAEVAQYQADPSSFKDAETADYVGVAVHCAKDASTCSDAQAVKYGSSSPAPSAVADNLPTEPGGYLGYQALFGHRYVAPQLGAGTPSLTHNGYPVTDSAGNLTDLDGNTLINSFAGKPGFPGFSPTATQSLAYLADMQESGIPVTYGYISDLHERKPGSSQCTTAPSAGNGKPLGPGDSCYVSNAAAYDAAFKKFFDRLAKDGITPANTEFVISAEENDQFAGANVGRATVPSPAGCNGVTVACNYTATQIGELQANINGLLSTTPSSATKFDIEPQGASIYVHGNPGAADPTVRQLQRDTAAMTADDPYTGVTGEKVVNYQAGAVEQRILHMQTSDPLRTPTYTLFPKPDYYFSTSGPNVSINNGFAYNHGYYSPNIDITWSSLVGPGVAARGVDGPQAAAGNQASDPNSRRTVPQASRIGTWVEETDLRPTLLHLTGLKDDYPTDGRVISQALSRPSRALRATTALAADYQQLNSSVGAFATNTLIADSAALASGTASSDAAFAREQRALRALAEARDALATRMKQVLADAQAGHRPSRVTLVLLRAGARALIAGSRVLAARATR